MTDPETLPDLPQHVEVALKLYAKDEDNMRRVLIRYASDERRRGIEKCLAICDRVASGGEMKTIGLLTTHDGGKVYSDDANYCAWEIRSILSHPEDAAHG